MLVAPGTRTLPLTTPVGAAAGARTLEDWPALGILLLALALAELLGQDANPQGTSMESNCRSPWKSQAQGHGSPQTPHLGYPCPSEVPSQTLMTV